MATRANYTANASVRHATSVTFFFCLLQLKPFFSLVLPSSFSLLLSSPLYSSCFLPPFSFSSHLISSTLLFMFLSSPLPTSTHPPTSPYSSPYSFPYPFPHITYPRTCCMLPPYQKSISPSAENVPRLTGPYLRVTQNPFVVKEMKLKLLY